MVCTRDNVQGKLLSKKRGIFKFFQIVLVSLRKSFNEFCIFFPIASFEMNEKNRERYSSIPATWNIYASDDYKSFSICIKIHLRVDE